jgi:hypothetical protein
MDRLPGTELRGKVAPRGASPCDPEEAREDGAVVVMRAASAGFLRGQKRDDVRPLLVGQFEAAGKERLDDRETVGAA